MPAMPGQSAVASSPQSPLVASTPITSSATSTTQIGAFMKKA